MNGENADVWLLFSRRRLASGLQITFARGSKKIQSEFRIDYRRSFNFAVAGELLGAGFVLEALSRNRLDEDDRDSHEPRFVGTFEHEGGCSGDFSTRPANDGEVMKLGVYGVPQVIRLCKTHPSLQVCPVEMLGVSDVCARLESIEIQWRSEAISSLPIPKPLKPRHYVGLLQARGNQAEDAPPMVAVITALVICYEEILTRFYLADLS